MEWVASNLMNKHKSIIAELVTKHRIYYESDSEDAFLVHLGNKVKFEATPEL